MEFWDAFWNSLGGRLHGPLEFRLLLQPIVASVIGIRAGMKDAKAGRPIYLWAVVSSREHRRDLIRDGWKDVARIFSIAAIMDVAYQLIVFRRVYPIETLIVAALLAPLPYALARGLTNRFARRATPRVGGP